MAETTRRLAGILSADVAGYSRLMGADEQATIADLDDSRRLFREIIEGHEGRVVDMAGDSVLATFESIVEAVASAAAIQERLAERNRDRPEARRMRYRIGVNLGDVVAKPDGSVYGDGVNVAARLESLAEPGGITISGTAYDHVADKLGLVFESLGEQSVKNIARPVRVYRVAGESAPAQPASEAATGERPSIAVLALDNLSNDADQEYFADGIAEDLITALSRIRWLRVIARNSSFSYKGSSPDVRKVGSDLGARYVFEGSVRKAGNRVRISAQVVDTRDGRHVWAERFDRELVDIFDVQDEIVLTIAGAIEPEIGLAEGERAHSKPVENLDAWDLYQRGLWHMWRFSKADNARAQALFGEAIAHDPNLAAAHANLAYSHFLDAVMGYGESAEESIDQAITCARRAVAIDDKDAMAHCALGRADTARGLFKDAIAELTIALDLNPSFALAHFALGVAYAMSGQAEAGLPHIREARQLSPFDPYIAVFEAIEGATHVFLGQYEAAEELAQSASRRPRTPFWSWATLASALGHMGREDEARRALAKLLEMNPDFSIAWWDRAWVGSSPVIRDRYFEGLYKAGLERPGEADKG